MASERTTFSCPSLDSVPLSLTIQDGFPKRRTNAPGAEATGASEILVSAIRHRLPGSNHRLPPERGVFGKRRNQSHRGLPSQGGSKWHTSPWLCSSQTDDQKITRRHGKATAFQEGTVVSPMVPSAAQGSAFAIGQTSRLHLPCGVDEPEIAAILPLMQ